MTQIVIVGNSGFIGRQLQKEAELRNFPLVGISSKFVDFKTFKDSQRTTRPSGDLNLDIRNFLTNETIVINTAWISNGRDERNSRSHIDWANLEISLIESVISTGCRYVSLGSIAEINDDLISTSYGTVYSEAKNMIFEHLSNRCENFLWIRIASAFGKSDSRKWLMTELLEKDGKLSLRNPSAILNLTDVATISTKILETALSESCGSLNFWSYQWMSLENIKKCFVERSKPILTQCNSNYFSEFDPDGFKVDSESILDFFDSATA